MLSKKLTPFRKGNIQMRKIQGRHFRKYLGGGAMLKNAKYIYAPIKLIQEEVRLFLMWK